MIISTKELKEVETLLAGRLKIDYTNFSDNFFRRRLSYLFEKMRLHRVADLTREMSSLISFDEITYYLSVPGSEMFRAPSFWRLLRKLLQSREQIKNIWLPCVSSYHELYSLLVILNMTGRTDYTVTANVISDKIKEQIASCHITKKDSETDRSNFERLESTHKYDDYVVEGEEGPLFRQEFLKNVKIRNGWFMNISEPEKYDLILFRNVLLTYNNTLHRSAVTKLTEMLGGKGSMLCLGAMERLLAEEDKYDEEYAGDSIYTHI